MKIIDIFLTELKSIFKDSGVMVIFFVAGIAYPLLYNYVYYNETLHDIPVAVVDDSGSSASREFIKKLEATKEVEVISCVNMDQAEALMTARDVHGIVMIPRDFNNKLVNGEQAHISTYMNMSCFMVYKAIAFAVNYVMLDEMRNIQIDNYAAKGVVGEQAEQMISALPYEEVILYNPANGFTSFFLPALLVIIIYQTLFFGTGMLGGTMREEKRHKEIYPVRGSLTDIFKIVIGKSSALVLIYSFISVYVLVLIPRIFNLPVLGSVWDVYRILLPFLIASTFFAISFSLVVKNRETGMVMFLFFSIILLFLSGFSWPFSNMPLFWRYFSYLFPSTFGVQSFIKINSMGAEFSLLKPEFWGLCIQSVVYFIVACLSVRYIIRSEHKPEIK